MICAPSSRNIRWRAANSSRSASVRAIVSRSVAASISASSAKASAFVARASSAATWARRPAFSLSVIRRPALRPISGRAPGIDSGQMVRSHQYRDSAAITLTPTHSAAEPSRSFMRYNVYPGENVMSNPSICAAGKHPNPLLPFPPGKGSQGEGYVRGGAMAGMLSWLTI